MKLVPKPLSELRSLKSHLAPSKIASAMAYARRDWPVFPLHSVQEGLCSCGGEGCNAAGKHPRITKWQNEATTDSEVIQGWWRKWPDANVGVVTGQRSGLLVVDADSREAEEFLRRIDILKFVVQTERGCHVYVRRPPLEHVPSRQGLRPKLDVKCDGGYVVGAGSVHASGTAYCIVNEDELPEAPDEIIRLLLGSRQDDKWLERAVNNVENGAGRNDEAVWLSSQLRDSGVDRSTAESTLRQFSAHVTDDRDHSYSENEAVRTLDAVFARSPRPPAFEKTYPKPVMGRDAFHGILGEIVDELLPHTEADGAALLTQSLVIAGNLLGRKAWTWGEGEHRANLFVVIVAPTGAGKGVSYTRVKEVFDLVDSSWQPKRGISTGEGIINVVRDPRVEPRANKDGEEEDVVIDAGVGDKRALFYESEFGSVLKRSGQKGSTVVDILKQAWDGDPLATAVRHNPLKATGHHISVIGHITPHELNALLSKVDRANGFVNRFLWVLADRSKSLPIGSRVPKGRLAELAGRVSRAIERVRDVREWTQSSAASELWVQHYTELQNPPEELSGIADRARPQVVRLALIYAVLDGSELIDRQHLAAALEVWRYCQSSAQTIFNRGNRSSSDINRLKEFVVERGKVSRTQVSTELFKRKRSKDDLDQLFDVLAGDGFRITEASGDGRSVVFIEVDQENRW